MFVDAFTIALFYYIAREQKQNFSGSGFEKSFRFSGLRVTWLLFFFLG